MSHQSKAKLFKYLDRISNYSKKNDKIMSLAEMELLHKQATMAEEEIKSLTEQIALLQQAIEKKYEKGSMADKCEIERLQQENIKLKHRIEILKRTIEAQRGKSQFDSTASQINATQANDAPSIYNNLYEIFQKAIITACPDISDPPVIITFRNHSKFGDYQCNSAMNLVQSLRKLGLKITSVDIANNIVKHLEESPLIDKCEVAPPGFINIFIKRNYGQSILSNWLKIGEIPPPRVEKKRIIVDFSSPNIAKEMHVGHLRSTIIGDSIAKLLEYLGHEVLRLNHIGDWGTQFGMLIAHLQDKFPDYTNTIPPIEDLQTFYKESKSLFDTNEAFKKRAYNCVVKLQAFDPEITKAWEMICDVSRQEFKKIYAKLDIKIIERGESFYQKHMELLIKELESKNMLEEDEGRKVMWGGEPGNGIPLTMVKSDGGFTYDTSDMAALKQRIEEERADWLIYVTDAGQSLHFETLKNCAKKAGILKSNHRMDHVSFGLVLDESKKKFKTRSGDTIKLTELLDEGLKRTLQKLEEKERNKVLTEEELKIAQESVAYSCIKYADLAHNRNHEYVFSFNKMLEDKGNTAVYLLYALTRIRSIARTANITQDELRKRAHDTPISLVHEKEWKLAKILLKFPDVILCIAEDMYLHQLCDFCYDISCAFTEFYDKCYCIEKNETGEIVKVNIGRLLLTEVTAIILEKCFSLLGLKPVAKM